MSTRDPLTEFRLGGGPNPPLQIRGTERQRVETLGELSRPVKVPAQPSGLLARVFGGLGHHLQRSQPVH